MDINLFSFIRNIIFISVSPLVICIIIKLCIDNRIIPISEINIRKKNILDQVNNASRLIAIKNCKETGKLIYTQKGQYRVAFMKMWNSIAYELKEMCFKSNGSVNKKFKNYIQTYYPVLRYKHLCDCLYGFYYFSKHSKVQEKARKEYEVSNTRTPIQRKYVDGGMELEVSQFFRLKELSETDYPGCYILHNEYIDEYYVGQGKKLLFRVNQHFTGHGNGDVYVDYKRGNHFTIRLITLAGSGFNDLNSLEKYLIEQYDAYESGYNKTKGNG